MTTQPRALSFAAAVAVVFGLMTLASGGKALFGSAYMGAVVPFVLWFNFLAGFAYVLAGVALWRGTGWAAALAIGIALATAAIFVAFLWHVWRGGAYEMRTMFAMALRLAVWVVIGALASRGGRQDQAG